MGRMVVICLVSPKAAGGSNLIAGDFMKGLYHSTNYGASWVLVINGIGPFVLTHAVNGTKLFAGTYGGVYLSTNTGTSWTAVDTDLTHHTVAAIAVSGNNVFAGTGSRIDIGVDFFPQTTARVGLCSVRS